VDTIENIIRGSMEGLNMDLAFASFVTGFSALARGNANIDMLSIGHPSIEVPPLPGCIDGPEAGGLAKHGRFEGDVSNSRQDAGLGNQVDFSMEIYDGVSPFSPINYLAALTLSTVARGHREVRR